MRRICSVVFLVTMLPCLSGCHHGSTTTTTPLSPMGMGQAPTLNPFGSATRVAPPPTGNHAAPVGYLGTPATGGAAPATFGAPPTSVPSQNTGTPFSSTTSPINSPSSGWTTTQPATTGQVNVDSFGTVGGVAPVSTFSSTPTTFNTSAGMNPRAGGMPVIDMTASPPPPGYQPTYSATVNPAAPPVAMAAPQTGYPTMAAPQTGYPTMAAPQTGYPTMAAPQTGYPTAGSSSYPTTAFPSTNTYPTSGSSSAFTGQLTPLPPTNDAVPIATAPTSTMGGTTQGTTATDSSQLIWRTPGTPY